MDVLHELRLVRRVHAPLSSVPLLSSVRLSLSREALQPLLLREKLLFWIDVSAAGCSPGRRVHMETHAEVGWGEAAWVSSIAVAMVIVAVGVTFFVVLILAGMSLAQVQVLKKLAVNFALSFAASFLNLFLLFGAVFAFPAGLSTRAAAHCSRARMALRLDRASCGPRLASARGSLPLTLPTLLAYSGLDMCSCHQLDCRHSTLLRGRVDKLQIQHPEGKAAGVGAPSDLLVDCHCLYHCWCLPRQVHPGCIAQSGRSAEDRVAQGFSDVGGARRMARRQPGVWVSLFGGWYACRDLVFSA